MIYTMSNVVSYKKKLGVGVHCHEYLPFYNWEYIYVKRGFWGKNPRDSCRTAYNRKIDVIQSLVNNPGTAL